MEATASGVHVLLGLGPEATASEATASETTVYETTVYETTVYETTVLKATAFGDSRSNSIRHDRDGFSLLALDAQKCGDSPGKRGDSPQGPSSKKLLV